MTPLNANASDLFTKQTPEDRQWLKGNPGAFNPLEYQTICDAKS